MNRKACRIRLSSLLVVPCGGGNKGRGSVEVQQVVKDKHHSSVALQQAAECMGMTSVDSCGVPAGPVLYFAVPFYSAGVFFVQFKLKGNDGGKSCGVEIHGS